MNFFNVKFFILNFSIIFFTWMIYNFKTYSGMLPFQKGMLVVTCLVLPIVITVLKMATSKEGSGKRMIIFILYLVVFLLSGAVYVFYNLNGMILVCYVYLFYISLIVLTSLFMDEKKE